MTDSRTWCARRIVRHRAVLLCAVALFTARPALAEDVGTIAAIEPTAEIGRGGEWTAAALGSAIRLGDTLRTGPSGRLRIVFRDDSVVTMSGETQVAVDEQLFSPDAGSFRSALRLLQGKMRALVSEYYGSAGASFEVQSKTGVAGVRGTDFVALYDERREVMEVVGISGRVAVASPLAVVGSSVFVTEREMTSVERGKLPTAPIRLDDVLFRQYLDGLEFIGAGRPESLAFGAPVLTGDAIPEGDGADTVPLGPPSQVWSPVPGEPVYAVPDVSTLLEQPPLSVAPDAGLGIRF